MIKQLHDEVRILTQLPENSIIIIIIIITITINYHHHHHLKSGRDLNCLEWVR